MKITVWAYMIVLSLGTILSLYMPKTEAAEKESIVIPGEAIRLRILANSDFTKDQAIKRKVRDAVNAKITLWVQDLTSMEKARAVIKGKLPEIQETAEKVVREHGSDQPVKVEFGKVQFPTKLYGQYLYPAGEYQAVLITLGSGEGANWWCVLYPPLCFLDFSNGVAVSDGFDEKKKVKAETAAAKVEDKPEVTMQPAEKDHSVEEEKAAEVKPQAGEDDQKTVQAEEETPQAAPKKHIKEAPLYTAEDEQPVKVKFFVVEMWKKLID